MLSGRRLLVGVSGGIAAYKAAELVRLFIKADAQVQVVMTEAATRFVGTPTFQALSGRPVRTTLWDEAAEAAMGHIELARWPDAIVIAPASADVIARLAHGHADDLLTTLCLASDRPLFVVPAMNRLMWANPATQENIARLRARHVHVIGPGSGEQACGEVGEGRMSEPAQIVAELTRHHAGGALAGVRAVVTAGPTREPLDPVRVLTNRSSGKQGFAVAEALRDAGAAVTLVAGPVSLAAPAGVRVVAVESAQQMLEATLAELERADLLVGTAAVADYRPETVAPGKIKKTGERMEIAFVRNADILVESRQRFPRLFIVGFAAETERVVEQARAKREAKGMDLIAANWVGEGRAFDADHNALEVIWSDGAVSLPSQDKRSLARELVRVIAQRYPGKA